MGFSSRTDKRQNRKRFLLLSRTENESGSGHPIRCFGFRQRREECIIPDKMFATRLPNRRYNGGLNFTRANNTPGISYRLDFALLKTCVRLCDVNFERSRFPGKFDGQRIKVRMIRARIETRSADADSRWEK